MSKRIYARGPINVAGTMYEAGQEIKCGQGARDSLLRMGQASETWPPEDFEAAEEGTPIDELGLAKGPQGALVKNGITTIEGLCTYIDRDKKLTDLKSVGEPTAKVIEEALDAYLAEGDEEEEGDEDPEGGDDTNNTGE